MPTLTVAHIRENPWNVLLYPLPPSPSELLLMVSWIAASYCRQCETKICKAEQNDEYVSPDQMDEFGSCSQYDNRLPELDKIIRLIVDTFCETAEDGTHILK